MQTIFDYLLDFYMVLGFSTTSHEPVLKKGEELLKKNASGVNLDDQNLISRLFLLFNGMQHNFFHLF